jgi:tetratricopeptide (TPR) repeat protein
MRRVLVALMLLSSCSSAPQKTPPNDPALSRLDHAGDIAFNQEQPKQAAEEYRAALGQARTRDDVVAIADAGFNLATAELRGGQPRSALQTAQELREELARRHMVDRQFDLVSATAMFRLGDFSGAEQMAAGLTGSKDPALANAAWFLLGLLADRRGDKAGLERAVASMTSAADGADVAELRSRLTHSRALALRAADLRRDQLDYRGMARALALAARFTPDPAEAADLYLRAGRSAAAQGEVAEARTWLGKARELARDKALRAEAAHALRDLPEH